MTKTYNFDLFDEQIINQRIAEKKRNQAKRLEKKRKQKIKRLHNTIISIIVVILMITTVIAAVNITNERRILSDIDNYSLSEVHIVKEKETLWQIADKYNPEGLDIRVYIKMLKEVNDIHDYIYPGQCLDIPVFNG